MKKILDYEKKYNGPPLHTFGQFSEKVLTL